MGPGFESLKVHHRQVAGTKSRMKIRVIAFVSHDREVIKSPKGHRSKVNTCFKVSVSNAKGPPVPIPNTEVKLCSGDNTCLETSRDDSSSLTQKALKVNTFKAFFKKIHNGI